MAGRLRRFRWDGSRRREAWTRRGACGGVSIWCGGRRALLQHGSLLIAHEAAMWDALFGSGSRAITLEEILGTAPPHDRIHQALVRGFETEFEVRLEASDYTSQERHLARTLVRARE